MTHLIYPSLQGPVLTESQRPETVTEARWHQPWSLPAGRLGARRAAAFAVALIASGQTFDPAPLPNTGETIDQWGYAWSEPVRTPRRLAAAANPQHGFVQAAPFEEAIEPGKWFAPLSEPVRLDFRTRLRTAAQPAATIDPAALTRPESVTEDRWHQPWSEPQRDLAARRNLLTLQVASQPVSPDNPFGMTEAERVSLDKFLVALSEPVRLNFRTRLRTAAQPAALVDPTALTIAEFVPVDRWQIGLSEPVRLKRGLRAQHQVDFTISPIAFTIKPAFAQGYVFT